MRAVYTFVRGIEDLKTSRFQLHNQVVVLSIDKLASEAAHGLSVPITPVSIVTIREVPPAEVDGRFRCAKIR